MKNSKVFNKSKAFSEFFVRGCLLCSTGSSEWIQSVSIHHTEQTSAESMCCLLWLVVNHWGASCSEGSKGMFISSSVNENKWNEFHLKLDETNLMKYEYWRRNIWRRMNEIGYQVGHLKVFKINNQVFLLQPSGHRSTYFIFIKHWLATMSEPFLVTLKRCLNNVEYHLGICVMNLLLSLCLMVDNNHSINCGNLYLSHIYIQSNW